MALFKFTRAMLAGEAIDVYNQGQMKRDFTYIDDVAEAVIRLQDVIPQADADWTVETGSAASSSAPYRIYNLGNSQPVSLIHYIEAIEKALGVKANKNLMPMQPGDVLATSADTTALFNTVGFKPQTGVDEGVKALCRLVSKFLFNLKIKKGSDRFLFSGADNRKAKVKLTISETG
ncbi:NAD-dependent epimerase/dehydratase family protein [Pantoea ananatis]